MAATVPTKEPAEVRAGDTWQWRREDLSDYPASVWTLKYYFRSATQHFDVTASADGDLFAVSVAMATTAAYTAGKLDWTAEVSNGTERYTVDTGILTVLPDLSVAANVDARSFARTMLDAVEAALSAKATAQQLDIIKAQLELRRLDYDTTTLMSLRVQFKAEVRAEENARRAAEGRTPRNRILALA